MPHPCTVCICGVTAEVGLYAVGGTRWAEAGITMRLHRPQHGVQKVHIVCTGYVHTYLCTEHIIVGKEISDRSATRYILRESALFRSNVSTRPPYSAGPSIHAISSRPCYSVHLYQSMQAPDGLYSHSHTTSANPTSTNRIGFDCSLLTTLHTYN